MRDFENTASEFPELEELMLVKIYALLWAGVGIAAGGLYVSGNLTMLMLVVLGFVCFGLVFMGMMSVLPATVVHAKPAEHHGSHETPEFAAKPKSVGKKRRTFQTAWMSPNGAEISKPKYR